MALLISRDNRIIFTIFLLTTLRYLPIDVSAGICWYKMETPGFCKETLRYKVSKEQCCSDGSSYTAWSPDDLQDNVLFFMRALQQGVPCKACQDSCSGVKCGKNKKCVIKHGRPTCVCSPKCKYSSYKKGPVCGTDNRSYKSICRLKKQRCRTKDPSLKINYYGICQHSCKNIKCKRGKYCVQDQYLRAHCIQCISNCHSISRETPVCGDNGITYPNACQLQSASCLSGKPVTIAYTEACKFNATCEQIKCSVGEKCLIQRDTNLPKCISCSSCEKENEEFVRMCGTNNQTYNSLCDISRDSCRKGYVIEAMSFGPCKLRNVFEYPSIQKN